jgi:hypothetical protein
VSETRLYLLILYKVINNVWWIEQVPIMETQRDNLIKRMMGGVNSRLFTQVPTLGWPFLRNSKNKTKPNKTKQKGWF